MTLKPPGNPNTPLSEGRVYYNVVEDYGARGDGSHDDTAAFRSAITAAYAAGGGIIFIPGGTYKLTNELVLPNVTTFGPAITLQGAGLGTTTLSWGSLDLGAGKWAIRYDDVNGPGVAHSLRDLTMFGPGVNNGLGVAPCNMNGIRMLNQFIGKNLYISRFNQGITREGDHHLYDNVHSNDNLYGVYVGGVVASSGDVVFRDCDLTGNKMASVGVAGTGRLSGDRFISTHMGISPYCVWGESGTEWLVIDTTFSNCGFESYGNAVIGCGTAARNIGGVTIFRSPAAQSNGLKLGGVAFNAVIETAGTISGITVTGHDSLAGNIGGQAFIKGASLDYCHFNDATNLVTALRASGQSFFKGAAATGSYVDTGSAHYEVLIANGAIVTDTLVGGNNNGECRPFANASFTPALGIAGCAGASGDGILVATGGYVPVTVGPTAALSNYDIVTFDAGAVTKAGLGTTTSNPSWGWVTSGAAANGTATIRVRVQFA